MAWYREMEACKESLLAGIVQIEVGVPLLSLTHLVRWRVGFQDEALIRCMVFGIGN